MQRNVQGGYWVKVSSTVMCDTLTGSFLQKKLGGLMLYSSTRPGASRAHNRMTLNSCFPTANSLFSTTLWPTAKLHVFLCISYRTKVSSSCGSSTASLTHLFRSWKGGGMSWSKKWFGSSSKTRRSILLMVTTSCIHTRSAWSATSAARELQRSSVWECVMLSAGTLSLHK